MRFRRSVKAAFAVMFVVAATTAASPAGADPVDMSCGVYAEGPRWVSGGHTISAYGSYRCSESQLSISVIVCLEPIGSGVPVSPYCRGQFTSGTFAQATVSAPCFPGLWVTVVRGASTAGRPALGMSSPQIITDCDPL